MTTASETDDDLDSPSTGAIGWAGRVGGVLLAVLLYLVTGSLTGGPAETPASSSSNSESPPAVRVVSLSPSARATAAIGVLMAVWWMSEAVPLAVTSLLPLILFPLAGVLTVEQAAAPYAEKSVFLFMGGFMIALAVEKWNLHRRIALLTVLAVGTQPQRLVGGVMLATALVSMWISNTATAAMMLPLGMSLVTLLKDHVGQAADGNEKVAANFGTAVMLGIAYASTIGGLGTLVGTPTNVALVGFAAKNGLTIAFREWMAIGVPLAFMLLTTSWWLMTHVLFPIRMAELPGGREVIRRELDEMGHISRGEITVLCVFTATALAWLLREPINQNTILTRERFDDTVIAMIGATLLFLLPVDLKRGQFALDWRTVTKLPWGVLLLFGGGFSLAEAIKVSHLANWIGGQVQMLSWLPIPVMVLVVVGIIVFLGELTSNTPTAQVFLPICLGIAQGIGAEPMLLLVPTTLAASCSFMLPVGTPPNALVFGTGHVSMRQMCRAGIWLNLLAIGLIPIVMFTIGKWVLRLP